MAHVNLQLSSAMSTRWNGQKEEWTYYVETEVSGHSKCPAYLDVILFFPRLAEHVAGRKFQPLHRTCFLRWLCILHLQPRDRLKAGHSEIAEWETEESTLDMSFDMDQPLEGG